MFQSCFCSYKVSCNQYFTDEKTKTYYYSISPVGYLDIISNGATTFPNQSRKTILPEGLQKICSYHK